MTESDRKCLELLAIKAFETKRYFEHLGTMNTSGKTEDELRDEFVQYETARANMMAAAFALSAAQERVALGIDARAVITGPVTNPVTTHYDVDPSKLKPWIGGAAGVD